MKLNIIKHSNEPFADRREAGRLLGDVLEALKTDQTVVLGIPRGGLVVAKQVAEHLDAPLDIILSRKLGAPMNPELAIGAVTEQGEVFLGDRLVREIGVEEYYLVREKARQMAEIRRRQVAYRKICPKVDLNDKDVIVVDDGVATGSTVQAALWSIHQERPRRLIGAFPVGPEDTLRRLSDSADGIICLRVPSFFQGVGQFYLQFGQVSEEEVLSLLGHSRKK
ncbi:MAG: phosphoribosyltransferase [Candidatus Omnitrophica bacterium]|nr:phosphoribosyltransferase [Candidatus Omnitrophota bacterium]MDE2221453.1 phosphoribosyltransferase [Candidatus Omnitrophota bacterium]